MPDPIVFFVPGHPAPGGSKKAFVNEATGHAQIVDDCERNGPWRDRVASFARRAYSGPLLDGPLDVRMVFFLLRPKGHYGEGANARRLKPSARPYPTSKPDALKLARAAEDALTGVLWRDDAMTVDLVVLKRYGEPGVRITVSVKGVS